MGDLIKIVAGILLVAFLLVFALPLIWLVIKMFVWLFGGLLMFLDGWFLILMGIIIVVMLLCR